MPRGSRFPSRDSRKTPIRRHSLFERTSVQSTGGHERELCELPWFLSFAGLGTFCRRRDNLFPTPQIVLSDGSQRKAVLDHLYAGLVQTQEFSLMEIVEAKNFGTIGFDIAALPTMRKRIAPEDVPAVRQRFEDHEGKTVVSDRTPIEARSPIDRSHVPGVSVDTQIGRRVRHRAAGQSNQLKGNLGQASRHFQNTFEAIKLAMVRIRQIG